MSKNTLVIYFYRHPTTRHESLHHLPDFRVINKHVLI